MLPTADVLNHAADLIQRFGWRREVAWPWDGSRPLSLDAAIAVAEGAHAVEDFGRFSLAVPTVHDHLGLEDERWTLDWNDEEGRTAEEVVAALRAAAFLSEVRKEIRHEGE